MKRMTEGLLAVLILAAADPVWACRWNTQLGAGSHMSLGATYASCASWGATRADVDTTDTWTLPTSVWSMCDYNSECQPSLTADGKTLY
jgi:hypothetical protein